MAKTSIVQDYKHPQRGATATLTLDDKIQHEAMRNNIKRPQGLTVSYHANPDMEDMHFGHRHPMKPWRLTLTNKIVMAYGMHKAMDVYKSRRATPEEVAKFHKEDYVDFLQSITPKAALVEDYTTLYGTGDDCPVFDGLWDYCSLYAGASLDAARKLTNRQSDIAINWSGGLHHAKKGGASGFCYINDIVVAILQLLLHHPRVLYIDIDVHHGDGVEEAFWSTDRVMTVSFHKYSPDDFFPGTGGLERNGPQNPKSTGAKHAVNVPLNDGIDDQQYRQLFQDVIGMCVDVYRPSCIVIQCGADSLGGDRLGCFNLNVQAHGSCVEYVKRLGVPLLVLGGGGYTPRNVAKAWAYETSVCIEANKDLHPNIPADMPLLEHFKGEKTLFPKLDSAKYENKNSSAYLQGIVMGITEQLRFLKGAPSVQLRYIPPDLPGLREEQEREAWEEKMTDLRAKKGD